MKAKGTIIRLIKKWWFWLAIAILCVVRYFTFLLGADIENFDKAGDNLLTAAVFGVVAVVLFVLRNKVGAEKVFQPAQFQTVASTPTDEYCIECPLKGVTFDNDDGTSRQGYLKALYESGQLVPNVSLEHYLFRGSDAIRVLVNGRCVGSVPADRVDRVLQLMEAGRIKYAFIRIEYFENEFDELIYRADIVIGYNPA